MERIANMFIAAGSSLIAATAVLNFMTYTVDGGQRAIIFDRLRGLRAKVYGEGMHFYVPIL